MSKEDPKKYARYYPSYIEPKKQVWIARKGDLMQHEDTIYKVLQIVKPAIAGLKPKIVIEEVTEDDDKLRDKGSPF